jgi:hypothetical protein
MKQYHHEAMEPISLSLGFIAPGRAGRVAEMLGAPVDVGEKYCPPAALPGPGAHSIHQFLGKQFRPWGQVHSKPAGFRVVAGVFDMAGDTAEP